MTGLRKQQELALALISLLKKFRINWALRDETQKEARVSSRFNFFIKKFTINWARHDKTPKEASTSYNPAVVYLSYWEDSISITL